MSALFESDYQPDVMRLFSQLAHAGSLAHEVDAVSGQAGSRAQGASVRLWLRIAIPSPRESGERVRVRGAHVLAARFEAYGCPHFLAAAEYLCRWLEGRSRSELDHWQWRELEAALAIPANKRARLLILEDALRRAAAAWDYFISAKVSATQSGM